LGSNDTSSSLVGDEAGIASMAAAAAGVTSTLVVSSLIGDGEGEGDGDGDDRSVVAPLSFSLSITAAAMCDGSGEDVSIRVRLFGDNTCSTSAAESTLSVFIIMMSVSSFVALRLLLPENDDGDVASSSTRVGDDGAEVVTPVAAVAAAAFVEAGGTINVDINAAATSGGKPDNIRCNSMRCCSNNAAIFAFWAVTSSFVADVAVTVVVGFFTSSVICDAFRGEIDDEIGSNLTTDTGKVELGAADCAAAATTAAAAA
jgi:hypothetical protein